MRVGIWAIAIAVAGAVLVGCEGGAKGDGGGDFQVVPNNVPPTVTGVNPRRGPVAGGTAITIFGANFVAGQIAVTMNGAAVAANVTSPNTITLTTPALAAGANPAATIVVTDTGTGLSATLTSAFGYVFGFADPAASGTGDDFGGSLLTPSAAAAGAAAIPGQALAVGDFNADGIADLAVGIPNKTVGGQASQGQVLVFLGQNANTLNVGAPITVNIPAAAGTARFGFAVAAGDVDGDGDSDLLVGAPGATAGATANAGQAFLYTSNGLTPPAFAFSVLGSPSNQTPEDHGAGGRQAGYGFSVAFGNFDADGDLDMVVGEPDDTAGAGVASGGSLHVFNVTLGPLTATRVDALVGPIANTNVGVSLATGQADPAFAPPASADVFVGRPGLANGGQARDGGAAALFSDGTSAGGFLTIAAVVLQAAAGQLNAHDGNIVAALDLDGASGVDLVRGRFLFDGGAGSADEGRVLVVLSNGNRTFNAAGGTTLQAANPGPGAGDRFGIGLALGDVNASNGPDIVVGADGNAAGTGLAFLFLNQGGGAFSNPPNETLTDPGAIAGGRFGMVIAIGDFNGDGFRDIAISAPEPAGAASAGRVLIFYSPR